VAALLQGIAGMRRPNRPQQLATLLAGIVGMRTASAAERTQEQGRNTTAAAAAEATVGLLLVASRGLPLDAPWDVPPPAFDCPDAVYIAQFSLCTTDVHERTRPHAYTHARESVCQSVRMYGYMYICIYTCAE